MSNQTRCELNHKTANNKGYLPQSIQQTSMNSEKKKLCPSEFNKQKSPSAEEAMNW